MSQGWGSVHWSGDILTGTPDEHLRFGRSLAETGGRRYDAAYVSETAARGFDDYNAEQGRRLAAFSIYSPVTSSGGSLIGLSVLIETGFLIYWISNFLGLGFERASLNVVIPIFVVSAALYIYLMAKVYYFKWISLFLFLAIFLTGQLYQRSTSAGGSLAIGLTVGILMIGDRIVIETILEEFKPAQFFKMCAISIGLPVIIFNPVVFSAFTGIKDVPLYLNSGCVKFPNNVAYRARSFNTGGRIIFDYKNRDNPNTVIGLEYSNNFLRYGDNETYNVIGTCDQRWIVLKSLVPTGEVFTEATNLQWIKGQAGVPAIGVHGADEPRPTPVLASHPESDNANIVTKWCQDTADISNMTGESYSNFMSSCNCRYNSQQSGSYFCKNSKYYPKVLHKN